MSQNQLFHVALNLENPWYVRHSELSALEEEGGGEGAMSLQIDIDFKDGAKLPCPECGSLCPVHDSTVKNWRHLNFWQHPTFLSARVPRVKCSEHGVRQVSVPWARPGSGFTLLFEAFVMALAAEMPLNAVARIVGEHDTRLWRVVRHHVGEAHRIQDWSGVSELGVDETSTRKGHKYATVFVDTWGPEREDGYEGARLLYMCPGRAGEHLGEFKEQMPAHRADPVQIETLAMDMSPAYIKGAAEHFPDARVAFDRYHVMKLAGDAVDTVRRVLQRAGATDIKGSLWALRGNPDRLSDTQQAQRAEICARHKEIARALALREELQNTWERSGRISAHRHLKRWLGWAQRSRLAPFVALGRTVRGHLEGILNYFPNFTTSASIESINNLIQTARRRARGYRNFENFRAIAYWIAGKLNLRLPSIAHSI